MISTHQPTHPTQIAQPFGIDTDQFMWGPEPLSYIPMDPLKSLYLAITLYDGKA